MQLADKMALVQSLADKVSPSAVKHITLCFSTHTHEQIDLEVQYCVIFIKVI